MDNLKQDLLEYVEKHPTDKSIKDKNITNKLDIIFEFVNEKSQTKTRKIKSALVILGLNQPPNCECGNQLEFVSQDKAYHKTPFGGWREFCSKQCSLSSPKLIDRRRNTNLERYGEISWAKTDESKKISKQKWSEEKKISYREKSKKTHLEKYGVDHFSKTQEYLYKRTATCLEKYGLENCFQDVEKVKNASIEKLGYYGWFSTEQGKEYLENNNPAKLQVTIDKRRLSFHSNRTEVNPTFCDIIYQNDKTRFVEFIHEIANKAGNHRKAIAKEIGISYSNLNFYMRRFDMEDEYLNIGKGSSYAEIEIYQFVKSFFPDAKRGDKTLISPKQIDIYVPSKQLAIEYDGTRYHSEYIGGKDPEYHLYKTTMCELQGIKLLHIFEFEWEDEIKKEIWKSIIKNKLGIIDNKIYARKCTFKEIDTEVARPFFETTHLAGFRGATYYFGLFCENELVSAIAIGKNTTSSTEDLELIRYSTKLNTVVVGGLSKLLKNCGIKNLMSFADRRISSTLDSSYLNYFSTVEITEPNWYGFKIGIYDFSSRWSYTKEELKIFLKFYDESKSAVENMFDNGYDRIHDCGNIRFSGFKL